MVGRYTAGAMNLPFFPLRSLLRDGPAGRQPAHPADRARPTATSDVYAVPPLRPDVAIIHAQRADAAGDTQMWGLLGCQKEAAFAADRVIVVVEELVDEAVIRADPNRTVIPGLIVDAVVVEPYGAHPSYVQGYYDRDNRFYVEWDAISRDAEALRAWLASGSTAWPTATSTWTAWARSGWTRSGRAAPRRRAPSTTGEYR